MEATAKANTNIALIKYWGKRDEQLFLPMNSSLSITLDQLSTTTTVRWNLDLEKDVFWLNGQLEGEEEANKISRFLDKVRMQMEEKWYATVESVNQVPTSAGFASSASGFAALAAAATKAAGLALNHQQLSILARQGSGSACRSIYGGFVEWRKGERLDGSDSYAIPILQPHEWDLSILSVLVESKKKKVLSREGMKRTVETSPFYSGWLEAVPIDMQLAKEAIHHRDFEKLGRVTESNAMKMHATTLGANPPFMYWQSATFDVMEQVLELRKKGIQAYFTIDAGPNVKVLCEPHDQKKVCEVLKSLPLVKDVFICHPGSGITYL
ncbi:diphosphomevalonate decarboxylase [Lederbergia sp. NSJ-179]|uniref:diphosphomevalonate decarboxylase n=1 Tax=Lederbergia sp. NSJ-179 TaxID=2931402 RepID=UPI001FD170B1|nr:diphosphomevalonate decarboxylase [Lederbergia sp. NSJ-179]MCJ7840109.1 diphosphomevalonate decarboxylase [Lederbergia sp. NSJ-179]